MKALVISNSIHPHPVIDVAEDDSLTPQEYGEWVDCPDNCLVGWRYDGGNFIDVFYDLYEETEQTIPTDHNQTGQNE